MSEIKALEKLRECANHESACFFVNLEQTFGLHRYKCGDSTVKPSGAVILNSIADKIEAEIADSYMRFPCDADGVPIRVGDKLECHANGYDGAFTVFAIGNDIVVGNHDIGWIRDNPSKWFHVASFCHHVKRRALEDVLNDFGRKFAENYHYPNADGLVDETADEIRELMKEGGDD